MKLVEKRRFPSRSRAIQEAVREVRTRSVRRLGRKLGHVTPEDLDRLVEGRNEIIAS